MVLLDDLLASADFKGAVNDLAREFRKEHQLPEVYQLGLVVPDVEAAAADLEARGLGPFFIAEGSPALWREKGEDRSFRGKLGLAHYHGFELELLEPGEGSDFYGECVDPEGRAVVQHLGFLVNDVDEWASRLRGSEVPLRIRGKIKSGPMDHDFAYMDTVDRAGLIIELISPRLFGRSYSRPSGVVHLLGRLQKLAGKRSIPL
jgi:hypothetical protein